jgi:2-methylisocitrate lyase-like PEP mutase family enzyme
MGGRTQPDGAAAFRALHDGPGFVLPNAWDAGSATILQQAGFPAIATTSAGIAWSSGLPDGGRMDRDTMLDQVARILRSVTVPMSVDLESGYGETDTDVAETVARAVALGVVGGNLEDSGPDGLFAMAEAIDRVAAARSAATPDSFFLNARVDTYFVGASADPFAETVERAAQYVRAGADGIFVPGVVEASTIRRLAESIAAPLNVVAGLANTLPAPTLFSLGVRRVSLGGSLARATFGLLVRAAEELAASGTLGFLDGAMPYSDLQRRFEK